MVYSLGCRVSCALILCCVSTVLHAEESSEHIPDGFTLQWKPDFSDKKSLGLEFTDPKAWKLSSEKGKHALALHRRSNYKPTVDSALSIALLTSHRFGDFVLEAELLQDGAEYAHRDLCVFFGSEVLRCESQFGTQVVFKGSLEHNRIWDADYRRSEDYSTKR